MKSLPICICVCVCVCVRWACLLKRISVQRYFYLSLLMCVYWHDITINTYSHVFMYLGLKQYMVIHVHLLVQILPVNYLRKHSPWVAVTHLVTRLVTSWLTRATRLHWLLPVRWNLETTWQSLTLILLNSNCSLRLPKVQQPNNQPVSGS